MPNPKSSLKAQTKVFRLLFLFGALETPCESSHIYTCFTALYAGGTAA